MSLSDIVDALESGLITEGEAAEQGMVDSVDDLYRRMATRGRGSWNRHPVAQNGSRVHRSGH